MSTTAQQLIEAGYAKSTANDPGKLAVDIELLAELDRTFQLRYALWSSAADDGSLSSIALTFAGTPASVTLPTDIIDVDRLEIGGEKANLIPVAEKERLWHLPPAIYRQGLSLISRGHSGDPVNGTALTLWLDDAPASITALNSVIDVRFPVRFHKLLTLDIALYLDTKDIGRDPAQHQKLLDEYQREEAMFRAVAPAADSALDRSYPHRVAPGVTA